MKYIYIYIWQFLFCRDASFGVFYLPRQGSKNNQNAYRSSRNIYNVKVLNALNVSSYDLVNNDTLVLDKETLNNFNKI